MGPGGRRAVAQCLHDRRIDGVIGMAQQHRPKAQRGVDVLAALVIPQVGAFAVADKQFFTLEIRQDAGCAGNITH